MSENEKLTGIERDLVVQYLIDGNVPVTLTPFDAKNDNSQKVHPLNSQIFPVAIKGEDFSINQNEILITNPSPSTMSFINKDLKVEFYFNRVGLYFVSTLKKNKNGLVLNIPEKIERIIDIVEDKTYDFSAKLYFTFEGKQDLSVNCIPWENTQLFSRPVWKSIPLENQKKAKILLEKYVEAAKIEKNAGNGIQLIPICNYLTCDNQIKMESMENRKNPLSILYVDHERIVFGCKESDFNFKTGNEYGLKLIFSIKKGPIISRDIFITFVVNKIYKDECFPEKLCADCCYTTIQEEDVRFIFEKATSKLFI